MTAITKIQCLDSKTLLVGPSLLTSGVSEMLKEVKSCVFSDQEDILCFQNMIDDWENVDLGDQEITYAIIANVYSRLIDDPDEFIELAGDDGVELSHHNGTYYPATVSTSGLENTLIKEAL